MTYAQGFWCAAMGALVGWMLCARAIEWHMPRCCRCSSRVLSAIANHHGGTLHVQAAPCLTLDHTAHLHHDDHPPMRPPGPPGDAHP